MKNKIEMGTFINKKRSNLYNADTGAFNYSNIKPILYCLCTNMLMTITFTYG